MQLLGHTTDEVVTSYIKVATYLGTYLCTWFEQGHSFASGAPNCS
jgi:hypothetical protein